MSSETRYSILCDCCGKKQELGPGEQDINHRTRPEGWSSFWYYRVLNMEAQEWICEGDAYGQKRLKETIAKGDFCSVLCMEAVIKKLDISLANDYADVIIAEVKSDGD